LLLPHPPATPAQPVREVLHGQEIVDPYRWLEDGAAPETRAWVAEQNAYTRRVLDALPTRSAVRERLDRLLSVGSVGAPVPRGERYFYARRDGRQDQPVLVVRQGDAERVVFDPVAEEASGLLSLDWWYASRSGRLIAYGTSRGGDEWSTLRVLDVETGQNLGADVIPRTLLCSVGWLPDDSGFCYTRYPEPGSVPAGEEHYHRHVFLHRLGEPWSEDRLLFGAGRAKDDWPSVQVSDDGRWLLVVVSQGWARTEVYLLDLHDLERAPMPIQTGVEAVTDGEFGGGGGGESLFLRTNLDAPNYRVLRLDLSSRQPEARREIVPERADRVISQLRPVAGRLAIEELEHASSRVRVYSAAGALEGEIELPRLGTVAGLDGEWRADSPLTFAFTSFGSPSAAYRAQAGASRAELLASAAWPPGLEPSPHVVEQVWYPSRDGTRISMFLVHRPDLRRDGQAPTVLTGYGGFNVSRTPAYDSALQLWLAAGGMFALPNLRGGGEYGEAWHQAGMLGNKQNVFDDFVGAADWLIENGYTHPERLAITGGSNGGLLVGAALTQRPELFKAVVCRVPLLDMLRYDLFGVAELWVPEYGSAQDAEQFRWLAAYSPYQHVRDGQRYPAVLLMAAEQDSRVDPLHARKMAARLQAAAAETSGPILLRIETEAGHGQGKPRHKVLDEATDIWSFLCWQLGVTVA
jgi:prolyl oligopeptidase